MSEVNPVGTGAVSRVTSAGQALGRNVHSTENATVRRGTDRVEMSQMAIYVNKLNNLPVRQDLVDSVRRQIDQGTYETPEKIEATINEFLKDAKPL